MFNTKTVFRTNKQQNFTPLIALHIIILYIFVFINKKPERHKVAAASRKAAQPRKTKISL